MNKYDVYYRAFKDYRLNTLDYKECQKERDAFTKSNIELEKLESIKYLCNIDEEWIINIEKGMEYVEKAVREERQFIRTNGEVVPIEKAKKISKQSVEHLAKHSNLITKEPEENKDIVPDEIYMVEKLSDYAVYENRFIYMLLCYLRDFINLRLDKIEKLRMTYLGNMYFKKEMVFNKRKLFFEATLNEKIEDNQYPIVDSLCEDKIKRIKECSQLINSLLNTDLMIQVAKSPMIKPPIVKTNVLKMNNNFKNALALYDYVASYKGDGFSFEEVKKDYAPYNIKIGDELAEIVNMASFLTFKYGNELESLLESYYQDEERKRKEEEAKKLSEQLNKLKRRALENNQTFEEYMILLEKRNRMLEHDSEELVLIKNDISLLNRKIETLNMEKDVLNDRIKKLENTIQEKIEEINLLNQKYIEDMEKVRIEHEKNIEELNKQHDDNLNQLRIEDATKLQQRENELKEEKNLLEKKYLDDINNNNLEYANKITSLTTDYENKIADLNSKIVEATTKEKATLDEYGSKVNELNQKIQNYTIEREKLIQEYEDKLQELDKKYQGIIDLKDKECKEEVDKINFTNRLLKAERDAVKVKNGEIVPGDEYLVRERFLELEDEYEAFQTFFKTQWKLTKQSIRKELLWTGKDKKNKKAIIENSPDSFVDEKQEEPSLDEKGQEESLNETSQEEMAEKEVQTENKNEEKQEPVLNEVSQEEITETEVQKEDNNEEKQDESNDK